MAGGSCGGGESAADIPVVAASASVGAALGPGARPCSGLPGCSCAAVGLLRLAEDSAPWEEGL